MEEKTSDFSFFVDSKPYRCGHRLPHLLKALGKLATRVNRADGVEALPFFRSLKTGLLAAGDLLVGFRSEILPAGGAFGQMRSDRVRRRLGPDQYRAPIAFPGNC